MRSLAMQSKQLDCSSNESQGNNGVAAWLQTAGPHKTARPGHGGRVRPINSSGWSGDPAMRRPPVTHCVLSAAECPFPGTSTHLACPAVEHAQLLGQRSRCVRERGTQKQNHHSSYFHSSSVRGGSNICLIKLAHVSLRVVMI